MSARELALPPELVRDNDPKAVRSLQRYFGLDGSEAYTGARFERWAGGGDAPEVKDRFTADDLVAVSLLSVHVPGHAALEILDTSSTQLSELLSSIDSQQELVDIGNGVITPSWQAWQAWQLLKDMHRVGYVIAGKLMARKRPRLLPVYDADVREAVGAPDEYWDALRLALRKDDRALSNRLNLLRDTAGIGNDVSALRVFDVVVWMSTRSPQA